MITLPARATHDTVASFARGLPPAVVAEPQGLVMDVSAMAEFDSSALALLLECRREAMSAGKTFSVIGVPERMRQLAGVYGIAELIPAVA